MALSKKFIRRVLDERQVETAKYVYFYTRKDYIIRWNKRRLWGNEYLILTDTACKIMLDPEEFAGQVSFEDWRCTDGL